MKKAILSVLLGLCAVAPNAALAHGDAKPRHGGVVQMANDLSFELVAQDDIVTLYVEDHGKPASTSGMRGTLTVLDGRMKSDAPLAPAGASSLVARGIRLATGAKAVATITDARGKTMTVRFNIR